MAVRRDTGEQREKKRQRSQAFNGAAKTVRSRSEIVSNRVQDWHDLHQNRHRENDITKEHSRKKTVTRNSKGVKRRGKA